jgi:acetolactate synthase-1/2/3 large subunit
VDYRVGYLTPPAVGPDATVISLDFGTGRALPREIGVVAVRGELRDALARLTEALSHGRAPRDGVWLAEATRERDAFHATLLKQKSGEPPNTGRAVVEGLRGEIDPDTYALVDGGNISQWFHIMMNDRYPGWWMTCGRSAVVGWGFPAAAAVSALNPGRRVLLLSGDGAATFTIAEIETAVRQRLPYVAVVADDSAWGIVVSGSRRRGTQTVASELGEVRFAEVARAFGARGVRVDDPSRLGAEIQAGFDPGEVTVLHVPIATGGPPGLTSTDTPGRSAGYPLPSP